MVVMIIGNSRVINYLEAVFRRGTWAHGYLLHGPENVGKETLATIFARSLLCIRPNPPFGGCRKCEVCQRPDLRGTNRFFCLRPENTNSENGKQSSAMITIGQVRELRRWLSLASERARAVLIIHAETLGGEAANALLKILEEPSRNSVFFLTSSSPDRVLPTIHSRVVSMRFSPVPGSELKKIRGATEELVRLSRGRPGALISMLADKELQNKEKELLKSGEAAYGGSIADALAAARKFADDERGRRAIFERLLELFRKDAVSLEREVLVRSIRRAKFSMRAFGLLGAVNVNPRLVADVVFLHLRRPGAVNSG